MLEILKAMTQKRYLGLEHNRCLQSFASLCPLACLNTYANYMMYTKFKLKML